MAGAGDFFVGVRLRLLRAGIAAAESVEGVAGYIVFATACCVGEGVVGVVDLLEFLGAGWTFGGVGGDAVGVVAEGLSGRKRSERRGDWERNGRTYFL